MKSLALCVGIVVSFSVFADVGPTNVGSIRIGMTKAEYLSAIGITPVDCNKSNSKDGKVRMSELKFLTPDDKTLCRGADFMKTGSIENIKVGDISYDVVKANYDSSKIINSIGHSSKAIFQKDRLISIEIYFPKVSLETLTTKYGSPKLANFTKIEACKNIVGNEFKNMIGKIDAIWTNGDVSAIFRTQLNPPRKSCSDGFEMQYYIIEERKKLEPIEAAIENFRKETAKATAKDSSF